MTGLTDPVAELVVAGCCIDNPQAARLAHGRLDAGDFHDQVLARLFAASLHLPDVAPDHGADPYGPMLHQLRTTAAAEACDVRADVVAELVATRTVMADTAGTYARRVADAAQRRGIARLLEQARLDLQDGAPLATVTTAVLELLGAA